MPKEPIPPVEILIEQPHGCSVGSPFTLEGTFVSHSI
jgi:hypothetical protein